jgi:hypothetical protein
VITVPQPQKQWTGFGYGLLGVIVFSLTLPATRIAVSALDPVFVGLGRAIVAAGLSLILLVGTRQPIPPLRFLPDLREWIVTLSRFRIIGGSGGGGARICGGDCFISHVWLMASHLLGVALINARTIADCVATRPI